MLVCSSKIADEEPSGCNKNAYTANAYGHGLFLFHCPECRRTLGYFPLCSAESPRHLALLHATILLPNVDNPLRPIVNVYDNICHSIPMSKTALGYLARNYLGRLDRFHAVNHTTCSLYYRFLSSSISDFTVFTSRAEQINSSIHHLSASISQSSQDYALENLFFLLSRLNLDAHYTLEEN